MNLWEPKRRIEKAYQMAITNLLNSLWNNIKSLADPFAIDQAIRNMVNSRVFKSYAESAAMKMVTGLFADNGRTWRQASRSNMQGKIIHEMLKQNLSGRVGAEMQQMIDRNARLISTLPLDVAKHVTNHIKERSLAGKRAETIAEEIQQMFPGSSKARAALIARTEVSKVSSALTESRSIELGIKAYIWRSSKDARVRKSHGHLAGVVVFFDNPPSPEMLVGIKSSLGKYHAGCAPNCRCYMEPIIDVDYISFPIKVYIGNSINIMTKAQFKGII